MYYSEFRNMSSSRRTLFSFLILLTAVKSSKDLLAPKFSWDGDRSSESGVPHLLIHFADGTTDVALLKPHNPIPVVENERASHVDPCIFMGHLRDEPDVSVALTGGCPFDDTFEVSFASGRLRKGIFIVKKGKVVDLPSIAGKTGRDVVDSWPGHSGGNTVEHVALKPSSNRLVLPPNGFRMKIYTFLDKSYRDIFGNDSMNVLRRTLTHAGNFFSHKSLTTKIVLTVTGYQEIMETVRADTAQLGEMAYKYVYQPKLDEDSHVFFCYDFGQDEVVGKALFGVVCETKHKFKKTAIVEWVKSDAFAGSILAHELGHTLGMNHDFENDDKNYMRVDSQGRTCTGIGGMMDYEDNPTKWSTCSVEDFTAFYSNNKPFCLEAL